MNKIIRLIYSISTIVGLGLLSAQPVSATTIKDTPPTIQTYVMPHCHAGDKVYIP